MAIFRYYFILLLSFCEVLAGTGINEDAAKHVGPSGNQPHDPNDDIAKIFTIQTAIKFSDGGHVMMLDEVQFGEITWGKRYKRPIEEVLKYANGIEGVEYQPYTEADKMDFRSKVRATGRLRFTKTIEKIRVQRKRDGQMEEVEFHIEEGKTTTVRRIVQKLQKIDWRWSILHGYQNQKNHLFEVGFTGHFTLILSEKKPEKDELEEIVRFHFTPNGLRIFRKSKGNKDYVIEADLSETEQPSSAVTNAEGRRGVYEKFNIPKPLMTEKYSINQLKQIGLNIVGGRKLEDQKFDCRAWGYLFILAIVPKERAKELRDLRNWPVDVQLEEEQFYQMGVPRMFKKYVPHFDYEKWINKQSAEVKKNDKNMVRKNERKDG